MDEMNFFAKQRVPWYYQPWIVLILIFFVLGPFGFPLLYKSPKFNRPWKIILTLLLAVYTVYLTVVMVELVQVLVKEIEKIQGAVS